MNKMLANEFIHSLLSVEQTTTQLKAWLQSGVDVNLSNERGYTALHCAAMADWDEAEDGRMELLLKAGARTEARANTQAIAACTPLMLAAAEGFPAQVRKLIEYGANVNAADSEGLTPLMHAIRSGFRVEEKVRALLNAGADVCARDNKGRNALDHARAELKVWKSISPARLDEIQSEREAAITQVLADQSAIPRGRMDLERAAAESHYDSRKAVNDIQSELRRVIQIIETETPERQGEGKPREPRRPRWLQWLRRMRQ